MSGVRSLVAGSGSTSQRVGLSRCEGRRRSAVADRADCAVGFGSGVGRGHGGRGHPTRRGRCRRLRGGGRGIGARCALHGTRPSAHDDDRSRCVRGPAARRGGDGLGADAPRLARPGREAAIAGRQPEGRSRDQPRLLPMRERCRCLGVSDATATVRRSSRREIVSPNACAPRSQSRGGGRPRGSSRDTRNRRPTGQRRSSPSPDCCSRSGTQKAGAARRTRVFWNGTINLTSAVAAASPGRRSPSQPGAPTSETQALAGGPKGVRQRRAGSSTDVGRTSAPLLARRRSRAARTRSPGVAQVDLACHPRADRNAPARTRLSESPSRGAARLDTVSRQA